MRSLDFLKEKMKKSIAELVEEDDDDGLEEALLCERDSENLQNNKKKAKKVNSTDNFYKMTVTVLHYACALDSVNCCNLLLDSRKLCSVFVDETDVTGCTALHFASFYNADTCVDLLLKRKANCLILNKHSRTPIEEALMWPSLNDDIDLSLSANELVNEIGKKDLKSLKLLCNSCTQREALASIALKLAKRLALAQLVALFHCKRGVLNIILKDELDAENGTIVNYMLKMMLDSSLSKEASGAQEDRLRRKMLECVLKFVQGWAPHTRNSVTPPLIQAIQANDKQLISDLLDSGAPVDAEDRDGNTALHWSLKKRASSTAHEDNLWLVQMLLDAGASLRHRNKAGATPVHTAAGYGNSVALLLLISKEQEAVNILSISRETPLHFASMNNHLECVSLLLNNGAKSDNMSLKNERPYDIAGSPEMRNLLSPNSSVLPTRCDKSGTSAPPLGEKENPTVKNNGISCNDTNKRPISTLSGNISIQQQRPTDWQVVHRKPRKQIATVVPQSSNVVVAKTFQLPPYKTVICKSVSVGQKCQWGSNCHFAHSIEEQLKYQQVLDSNPTLNDSHPVEQPIHKPVSNVHSTSDRRKSPEFNSRKVFVGGFPFHIHERDLKKAMAELFGSVEGCTIVYHTEGGVTVSRGFGFVVFENQKDADKAIKTHYISIDGKKVEIKKFKDAVIFTDAQRPNQSSLSVIPPSDKAISSTAVNTWTKIKPQQSGQKATHDTKTFAMILSSSGKQGEEESAQSSRDERGVHQVNSGDDIQISSTNFAHAVFETRAIAIENDDDEEDQEKLIEMNKMVEETIDAPEIPMYSWSSGYQHDLPSSQIPDSQSISGQKSDEFGLQGPGLERAAAAESNISSTKPQENSYPSIVSEGSKGSFYNSNQQTCSQQLPPWIKSQEKQSASVDSSSIPEKRTSSRPVVWKMEESTRRWLEPVQQSAPKQPWPGSPTNSFMGGQSVQGHFPNQFSHATDSGNGHLLTKSQSQETYPSYTRNWHQHNQQTTNGSPPLSNAGPSYGLQNQYRGGQGGHSFVANQSNSSAILTSDGRGPRFPNPQSQEPVTVPSYGVQNNFMAGERINGYSTSLPDCSMMIPVNGGKDPMFNKSQTQEPLISNKQIWPEQNQPRVYASQSHNGTGSYSPKVPSQIHKIWSRSLPNQHPWSEGLSNQDTYFVSSYYPEQSNYQRAVTPNNGGESGLNSGYHHGSNQQTSHRFPTVNGFEQEQNMQASIASHTEMVRGTAGFTNVNGCIGSKNREMENMFSNLNVKESQSQFSSNKDIGYLSQVPNRSVPHVQQNQAMQVQNGMQYSKVEPICKDVFAGPPNREFHMSQGSSHISHKQSFLVSHAKMPYTVRYPKRESQPGFEVKR